MYVTWEIFILLKYLPDFRDFARTNFNRQRVGRVFHTLDSRGESYYTLRFAPCVAKVVTACSTLVSMSAESSMNGGFLVGLVY